MKKLIIIITMFCCGNVFAQNYGYANVQEGYRWSTCACGEVAKTTYQGWQKNGYWTEPQGYTVKYLTSEHLMKLQDYAQANLNFVRIHPKYNGLMMVIWCPQEARWIIPECANRVSEITKEAQLGPPTTIITPTPEKEDEKEACCCCDEKKPDLLNPPAEYSAGPQIKIEAYDFNKGSQTTTDYQKGRPRNGKAGRIIGWTTLGLVSGALAGTGIWALTKIKPRTNTVNSPILGNPQPPILVDNTGTGGTPDPWGGDGSGTGTGGDDPGGTPDAWGGGKWEGPKSLPVVSTPVATSIMFTPPAVQKNGSGEYEFSYKPQPFYTVGITFQKGGIRPILEVNIR